MTNISFHQVCHVAVRRVFSLTSGELVQELEITTGRGERTHLTLFFDKNLRDVPTLVEIAGMEWMDIQHGIQTSVQGDSQCDAGLDSGRHQQESHEPKAGVCVSGN